MSFIYQLAVLGTPSAAQISELESAVADAVSMFGLKLGQEIGWEIVPAAFTPHQQRSAAVVFFLAGWARIILAYQACCEVVFLSSQSCPTWESRD